jgi:diguanylate cyclase (GGDEF)-like protein
VLVLTRDITDRKNAELALAEQAVHDPLTGLANRVLLRDRLGQALLRLERTPGLVAVLFLDLNRFKLINDTLGHAVGDALLNEIAIRLRALARRSDTVARFGGDEFVILCDRVATNDDARAIAERIAAAVARPFVHAGRTLHVTASIGIASTADATTNPEHLLRDADTAMYQAKERSHGAGRYQMFDPDTHNKMVSQLDTENDLREAIANGDLVLHYQPLHVLDTGELHGVEALARWPHPTRGLLLPDEFIPIAEQSGLIIDLGAWVLEEACRQLAEWTACRGTDRNPLTMAVNISPRQLANPVLPAQVGAALAHHAIAPELLCLEITETAMLEEAVSSVEALHRLHALGVRIALDDFGTGYSSLAHLRRFRVDTIKIDRSFVSGLDDAAGDTAIVGAITAMAAALGMTTVGEGIETAGQLEALERLGCDEGQGYYLSHAVPPDELTHWLAAREPAPPAPGPDSPSLLGIS